MNGFAGNDMPVMLACLCQAFSKLAMAASMKRVQSEHRKGDVFNGSWHGEAEEFCGNTSKCGGIYACSLLQSGFANVFVFANNAAGCISCVNHQGSVFDHGIVIKIGMVCGDQHCIE